MIYYDRIDVSEGIDINKTSASKLKSVIFVTIGIFEIKGSSSNRMCAIDTMIY